MHATSVSQYMACWQSDHGNAMTGQMMLQEGLDSCQQSDFGNPILRGAVVRCACELRMDFAEEAFNLNCQRQPASCNVCGFLMVGECAVLKHQHQAQ